MLLNLGAVKTKTNNGSVLLTINFVLVVLMSTQFWS